MRVWSVLQSPDSFIDTLQQLRRNNLRVVQGSRDGCLRDMSFSRNVRNPDPKFTLHKGIVGAIAGVAKITV
jgi:hypothetical protein